MFYSSPFNVNQISPSTVSFARGDVNGDTIPDNIFLTGTRTPDSLAFIQNITLVIQDGRTGTLTSVPLKSNAGYNPTLFLGNFTGNRVMEIMISIASGGSGGIMYYYIYSDLNNVLRLLFDYNVFNETHPYEVTFKDNYKVEVVSPTNRKRYIIDISLRGTEYLQEIYNANGTLKEPISGFVNPLGGLYPVDFDTNSIYELLAYQKVAGRYNADALGYIQTVLKWDRSRFVLSDQYLAIFGADI